MLPPRLEGLVSDLQHAKSFTEQANIAEALESLHLVQEQVEALRRQLFLVLEESYDHRPEKTTGKPFHYPASPLTRRELELLSLVRQGFTNKQVAGRLFISERTVKFHVTAILSKLYASTRTEAVDIALKRGIL
jgi:DNA-binding NarL/FixJ family response regulator